MFDIVIDAVISKNNRTAIKENSFRTSVEYEAILMMATCLKSRAISCDLRIEISRRLVKQNLVANQALLLKMNVSLICLWKD